MKKFKKAIVAGASVCLIGLTVTTFSASNLVAKGWRSNGQGDRGWGIQQRQQVPDYGFRTEMYDARIAVLAELSGKSIEEVKAKLGIKPMWAIMDEYKIDFKTFQAKMHEKAKVVVEQAFVDKKITETEKTLMLERMELNYSQGGMFGPGMAGKRGFRGNGQGQRGMGSFGWN